MGYFKSQIRRGRAREEKLAWLEPAREISLDGWQLCDLRFNPDRESFLRFVVETPDEGPIGLFRSSYLLYESNALTDSVRSALKYAYNWFNQNIELPRRLPRRAVCWFRADATESVNQMRILVEVFRMAGYPVWMHATRTPGKIVYQDELQVAAIPFGDQRKTSSVV